VPLLSADALLDDRFARDPYFVGCKHCSLLVVPISSQGELRAMLFLENRLGRDAFSTGRLDIVLMIAGQLAVSIDNALLYTFLEEKVGERTAALAAANKQLASLSLTDGLTGLVNRRGFDEQLEIEWHRAERLKTPLGLAMADIDHFKVYNDTYGHLAGDECLRRIGATIAASVRPGVDIAARYGGEEFALILPGSDADGTYSAGERLRTAVAALREGDGTRGLATISIGVISVVPVPGQHAAAALERADRALYRAKDAGRNCVVRA
jgi:diguanylate cyclase (GGDEF)-like protein